MSVYGDRANTVLQAVDEILTLEETGSAMVACQKRHITPFAAVEICGLAEHFATNRSVSYR